MTLGNSFIVGFNNLNQQCCRTWEAGYCHTYNPPGAQSTGFDNRIGLFLGHQSMNHINSLTEFNFKKFLLYIHERGQFWPRNDYYPIEIKPDQYRVLQFDVRKEYKV